LVPGTVVCGCGTKVPWDQGSKKKVEKRTKKGDSLKKTPPAKTPTN